MRKLGRFFKAAGIKGISFMTGGLLSFGISVYEHVNKSPFAAVTFMGLVAVAFSFGAYFSWKDTDDKLEEELAKSQKPEIRGEIVSLLCEQDKQIAGLRFFCLAKLVNHRNVPTTIKGYSLQLTVGGALYLMDGPGQANFQSWLYREYPFPGGGKIVPLGSAINRESPLGRSIEAEGWLIFERHGEIDELAQGKNCKAEALLVIDDALGARHEIRQNVVVIMESMSRDSSSFA